MNKIGLSDEGSKKKESRTEKNLQNALGIKEGSKRKDKAVKKSGLLGSPRILKDLKQHSQRDKVLGKRFIMHD